MDVFDTCLAQLKEQDRDRYLATLLMPQAIRKDIVALYAFNAEITRVQDSVSESMVGEIRLQWWRDAIANGNAGEGQGHPVATALNDVITRHQIDKELFERIITARTGDLYIDPFNDVTQLEGYLGDSQSLIFLISARIAGLDHNSTLADASGHAGVSYGLVQLMRRYYIDNKRGKHPFPSNWLSVDAGTAEATSVSLSAAKLRKHWSALASHAEVHLNPAKSAINKLDTTKRDVFLPLTLVPAYLSQMTKPSFDPERGPISLSQLKTQWLLWRGLN